MNTLNTMDLANKLTALKIPGQVVTVNENMFYIDIVVKFADNITVNKIKARQLDFNMYFGQNVEIVFDSGCVVLRLAKQHRQTVNTLDYVPNIKNLNVDNLPLFIGLDDSGNPLYYDLRKAPHLLVAGSTGSGKSVFIQNCILSLMCGNRAEIVLIDAKKVEFSIYNNLGGAFHDPITDINEISYILDSLCNIMDDRYNDMTKCNCREFSEYAKIKPVNPIVVIIDELADIMLQNRKAVEKSIIRIAQLGRACGIHLIVATQRPSTDIITGLIKSNIPSKISFSVSSAIDSRVIIDSKGAENLNGNGDGLFKPIGQDEPTRIQAGYIDTNTLLQVLEKYKSVN